MELIDFINSEDYKARDEEGNFIVSDEVLHANAQVYEEVKLWRIQGQVRKTQVETAVIVYDTLDRLKAQFENEFENKMIRGLAKAVHRALSKLYEYEFYINLADPTVAGMLANAEALGVLIKPEIEAITDAATYRTKPFENATLDQVRALRYPPYHEPVTSSQESGQIVTPEGDLVSTGAADGFRFLLTTRKAFTGNVNIRVLAKKADETVFTVQDSFAINISKEWEANTAYAHVFKRQAGLAGYRHFKFLYKAPFQSAFESVQVERVV